MGALKLTAKGQITIRKEVLAHLGLGPGDRVEVDLLPGGEVLLRSAPKGRISDVFGRLEQADGVSLSLEEISRAIADGWAQEP